MRDATRPFVLPSGRTIALTAALVALVPFYFLIPDILGNRAAHAPALPFERTLPVEPGWIYVYASIYVFALLPLFVVRPEELFRRAIKAYLLVLTVAYAGFVLYPATAPRPVVVAGGFAAWGLRLVYSLDSLYNCFPSLHVAHSFVSALACYRVHRGVGIAATAWASLVGVSTLFTKQHYAVDVAAGALIAFIAYVAFLRGYPREAVAECDRRLAPRRALGVVVLYGVVVASMWLLYRTGAIVV